MKEQVVNVLTNISILRTLVLATLVTPAQGQSLRHRIGANMPFGFIVADMKGQRSRPLVTRLKPQVLTSSTIKYKVMDRLRSSSEEVRTDFFISPAI
jgi:hypothetical protein